MFQGFLLQRCTLQKTRFQCLICWVTDVAPLDKVWSFVMVQLEGVEVHELKPKV